MWESFNQSPSYLSNQNKAADDVATVFFCVCVGCVEAVQNINK